MNIQKISYTARVDSTGGRDGMSRSDDGRRAVALSAPPINALARGNLR